jgi:glucose/arabinose dehydrogenase
VSTRCFLYSSGRVARALGAAAAGIALVFGVGPTPAQQIEAYPAGFSEEIVVPGLDAPNAFDFAPDGRIFICQQGGQVRIFKNGALLPAAFVSLNVNAESERGLLGIALDPAFATNGYVYLYYTAGTGSLNPPSSPKNRVSRFTANGDVAAVGSELILLDLIPSDAGNHNGGCVKFGADGYLYISTGDGGAISSNSQDRTSLAGKLLRITKTGATPAGNPYVGNASGWRQEIWSYGFRNPWRFNFQRRTGLPFVGDVGSSGAGAFEEVNVGTAGANYGWPNVEGDANTPPYTDPIFAYPHNATSSITGGDFYGGTQYPAEHRGDYFYGDYTRSYIRSLTLSDNNAVVSDADFGTSTPGPVDIQYHDQAIWYTSITTGTLRRIVYTGSGNRMPIAGDWNVDGTDTVGLYFPSTAGFFLRNVQAPGAADSVFSFGAAGVGWVAVSGDWDGNGSDTPGVFVPSTSTFFLKNSNAPGPAEISFRYGAADSGFTPLVGDWNGDGMDTVGLYNPTNGTFFLRNSNTPGSANFVFSYGRGGSDVSPLAGDWDGNGTDTVGIFYASTSAFFLRNSNTAGPAHHAFVFGPAGAGWVPIAGNWDNVGGASAGLYNRATGTFFLRNALSPGPADSAFRFGPTGG